MSHVSTRLIGLLLLLALWNAGPLWGQETGATSSPAPTSREQELLERLTELDQILSEQSVWASKLRAQLSEAKGEAESQGLRAELQEVERILQSAGRSFESIVTGGADLKRFAAAPSETFDWQNDLLVILEPILHSLKELSEKPRSIDRLRKTQEFYQLRLEQIERSLAQLRKWSALGSSPEVSDRLSLIRERWEERQEETRRGLEVAEIQLDSLLLSQESAWSDVWLDFGAFLTGRGLNLLLAVLVALLVWLTMGAFLSRFTSPPNEAEPQVRSQYSRILIYSYRMLMALVTTAVFLLILYVNGDWLLLGLFLLFLAGVAMGLRNFLPQFLAETRLILNLGPVREGEMVTYEGVPWLVKSINVYSLLVNPELEGGQLRLPLSEMLQLVSQPVAPDEPWFPTRQHDYVLLPEETLGQVVLQTPEFVQVQCRSMIRTFLVTDFIKLAPWNLSMGSFACVGHFGMAGAASESEWSEIPQTLTRAVEEELKAQGLGELLEEVAVELSAAWASTTQYFLYVRMQSAAAQEYARIKRLMQQGCVRACRKKGWTVSHPELPASVLPLPESHRT